MATPTQKIYTPPMAKPADSSGLQALLDAARDPEFSKVMEEYQKKKEPKMSLLQRVGTGLMAFETADAAYKKFYEGKKFLPEYAKDVYYGVKQAVTGRAEPGLPPKKTYKDIAVKLGMKDRPGKVDLVDIVGVAGDIFLDPSTYLGGTAGKYALKGIKGTGKFIGKKLPLVERMGSAVGELFTPDIVKAFQPLKELADPESQRMYRKGMDLLTKYQKGAPNAYAQAIAGVQELSDSILKNIPEKELYKISDVIETGVKSGNSFIDDAAKQLSELNQKILGKEQELGLIGEGVDNYLRRIASPEFREYLQKTGGDLTNLPKPIRVKLAPSKARKLDFKTITEANEWSTKKLGFNLFEENPFKATASRIIESEKAIRAKNVLDDLKYLMGRSTAEIKPGQVVDGLRWAESTAPQLKGVVMPETVVKYIDKTANVLNNADETARFLRSYDQVMNIWKGSVYGWLPQSHTTNAVGGMFNNYVAGVNPTMYGVGETVLTAVRKGDLDGTINLMGKELPIKEVVKWAEDLGILGETGRFELPGALNVYGKQATKLEKVGSAISKYPKAAMSMIEDRLRLPLFLDGLAKKMTPSEAAKRVIKYHFDYTPMGLSKFETDVMKRIIPFYTFTRNVIPLTLETMFLQPQKYTNVYKVARATGYEPTSEEARNLPEYLKEQILPQVGGVSLGGLKLPFEAGLQAIGNPLRAFGTSMSPAIKIPIESLTGKNIFADKDIKEDVKGDNYKAMPKVIQNFMEFKKIDVPANEKTGRKAFTKYTVNPQKKYIIENLPFFSRAINVALRVSQGKEDPKNLLPLISSIKTYNQTLEENKMFREKKLIQELQDILERLGGGYSYENFVIPKKKQNLVPAIPKKGKAD